MSVNVENNEPHSQSSQLIFFSFLCVFLSLAIKMFETMKWKFRVLGSLVNSLTNAQNKTKQQAKNPLANSSVNKTLNIDVYYHY